jgi:hypothetical protein
MLNGYATGVSGSPNPTISTSLKSLTGNSLRAYAYDSTWGVSNIGYPRFITNGNQLQTTIWAYDSAGIKSLVVRFIKNNETDVARIWGPYGNVQEILNQTYSQYTNYDKKTYTFSLTPGRYIFMSMATTTDGRTSTKFDYIEYGNGNVIATDFDTAYRKTSTGWQHFCALYDLSGAGINIPGCSLLMTKVDNASSNFVSADLRITKDAPFTKRYTVTGTVNPTVSGTYRTWINVQQSNGTYAAFNFLKYIANS